MLKITKTLHMTKFSEIPVGGILEFDNTIYVKIQDLISDRGNVTFNVVCLSEEYTQVGWFRPDDEVIYHRKAELTLSF